MLSTLRIPDTLSPATAFADGPFGPLWRLEAEAVLEADGAPAGQLVVRCLRGAPALLSAAPVLQHAARIDHPRLASPSWWSRSEDGLWIATPRPPGELLGDAGLDRLTWTDALDLWRPVAEAVQKAHSRGAVHAMVHPWCVFVDRQPGRMTLVDAGCWIGEPAAPDDVRLGAWIAPEMRPPAAGRDPQPQADVWGLARLLVALTLGPDEARKARPNLTGLPAFAIPAIDRALQPRVADRPARLTDLIEATLPRRVVAGAEVVDEDAILDATVCGIERVDHARFGDGVRFYLLRDTAEPDDARQGAFFYAGTHGDVYDSVRWAWEGANLHLHHARTVENSAGERFVTARPETLPVLAPEIPLSVSAVLKAEGCPSRFLVDERDRGGSSRPLVLGNLVHGLLDRLTEVEPPDFADAFSHAIASLRLDLIAAGLGDDDLAGLQRDARRHWDNIRRFTAPRGDDRTVRVGWQGRSVEVTRYSRRYGIEGRVDLVCEDDDEGLQIIELKSGSSWDGHLSQLRFYRFLWEGLATQRGLALSGHLLYSRDGRLKPAPMDDAERTRRILRARNELIACLRGLVDEGYDYRPPYHMEQPRLCRQSACNFRRDRCGEQTAILGLSPEIDPQTASQGRGRWSGVDPELIERGWAWHAHLSRLVEMERWSDNEALGTVLQPHRLAERMANHDAVDQMRLAQIDPARQTVTFGGDHRQLFTLGDRLLAHRGDVDREHVLRCRVLEVGDRRLTVHTGGAEMAERLVADGWILDRLPARIGFRQSHHALFDGLKHASTERLEVLLRPDGPAAARLMGRSFKPDADKADDALNPAQRRAVAAAVDHPHGALIQGPPGTGKTTVIAHAVDRLVERGQRVLVSAFTNTAVDSLLARLLEAGVADFVRVGSASRSPELARTLEAAGHAPWRFFTRDLARRTDSLTALAERLVEARVVASTTHSCVSSPTMAFLRARLGARPFDTAVVDEAAQITEPMTLAAINLAARFVLVGDHRQLPPIVGDERARSVFFDGFGRLADAEARPDQPSQDGATEPGGEQPEAPALFVPRGGEATTAPTRDRLAPVLQDIGLAGLDRSLFERLVDHLPHIMLTDQYRMHRDIMAYASRSFYGDRLRAADAVAERGLALGDDALAGLDETMAAILSPDHPVVFVDVAADEAPRHNVEEAEAVVQTIAALLEAAGDAAPSVGVVSPFRAQVQLIRRLARQRLDGRLSAAEVDTVERFQGSERDVICVSLVKTERTGDFLSDARRLNVTLTRARRKLVLFGHRACLSLTPLYRGLLEQPQTRVVRWHV